MNAVLDSGAEATLIVAEVFASLQGEGPSAGRPASFIRLSRCNLTCSFCDTPYTWDWQRFDPQAESYRRSVADLTEWALSNDARLVVITGGEPLLQQSALAPLVRNLVKAGRDVEIESNGTHTPIPELVATGVRFNVSPKLANTGLPQGQRLVPEVLEAWARLTQDGRVLFKFVARETKDLAEIDAVAQRFALAPVWVMPEGSTPEEVMDRGRALATEVIARNWSLTLRTHTLLWGDERGR